MGMVIGHGNGKTDDELILFVIGDVDEEQIKAYRKDGKTIKIYRLDKVPKALEGEENV